jgi:nitronate monooxygenase
MVMIISSRRKNLIDLFKIKAHYAIIQAPLAGVTTSSNLIVQACKNGCIGSIGSGYMTPDQLKSLLRGIRMHTNQPVNVNLMVPETPTYDPQQIRRILDKMAPIYNELQLPLPDISTQPIQSHYHDLIDVVISEPVPIVSFVFGIPEPDIVDKLKSHGKVLIGTATSIEEAIAVQEAGLDAVVAQGIEAGGHRGDFLPNQEALELFSLIPQVVGHVKIPVMAAGGIADGRAIVAAANLGAAGVQIGTAFLTTHECDSSPAYKRSILTKTPSKRTKLTRAYSGKLARGIETDFMTMMEDEDIPDYPLQNYLTASLRRAASLANEPQYMSLWAGQSFSMCRSESVTELVDRWKRQCLELGMQI